MNRNNGQADDAFGTNADYTRALRAVLGQGVPPRHVEMLREHYLSPKHTTTWPELARKVGYINGDAVHIQYGRFAARIANELGIHKKPEGFWLYVIAKWAPALDSKGHTRFVLRAPVRQAMIELGMNQ